MFQTIAGRALTVIVGSCAAFVVVSAQTPAKSDKVPITTASEEARTLYPVERISPFPETIALLERLGAKNNHHCVGC